MRGFSMQETDPGCRSGRERTAGAPGEKRFQDKTEAFGQSGASVSVCVSSADRCQAGKRRLRSDSAQSGVRLRKGGQPSPREPSGGDLSVPGGIF